MILSKEYISGFFDGEGSIGIYSVVVAGRRERFHLRTQVTQNVSPTSTAIFNRLMEDAMFVVTEDWIERNCTKAGGWNKIQLVQLGVSWPPKSGWKKAAVGRVISDKEKNIFEAWSVCSPETIVTDTPKEKVLDIYEFDDLIDAYSDAGRSGNYQDRIDARRALKDAYRAALRAAGKSDR